MNQVQRFCSSVMLVAVISGCLLWGRVMAQSTSPSLALPVGLPATVAQRVTVPMNFRPGGAAVGSLIFSIDFDESCLGFDASDQNNDGLLDSVRFTLPAAFQGSVAYAATDTDGELDFVIADYAPPIVALPNLDGLVAIDFTPLCSPTSATPISAAVRFARAPAVGFGGVDGRELTGTTQDGVVTITLPPSANVAPVANPGTATASEDVTKTIRLTASDANGDTLRYTIVTQPTHGVVTLVNNTARYAPVRNYYGADSFTFKVNDGFLDSNIATVAVTVLPVNDRPSVVSERITLPEDSVDVTIPVLANDSDIDGDSLSLLQVGRPNQVGMVTIQGNALLYNPAPNFFGTETFTYTVSDGQNGTATGWVTAIVRAVNDAPDTVARATVSDNRASFAFHAVDVDSTLFTFQCALDGGAFTACTSPKHYTNLGFGLHRFQVRGRDNRSLADPTPATYDWRVASATLTIVLDAQPDSGLNRVFTSDKLPRFLLDDTNSLSDTDVYTRTKRFTVLPGSYTFTEAAANGWHLRDILCSPGANATVNHATRTVAITVADGDQVTCTFTEQQGGTVVVRSFADLNGNGLKTASEPYTNGVTLRLYSAPGTVAASQTTATLVNGGNTYVGYSRFSNVRPGVYALCMVPPAGWVATRPATVMTDYDNLPCFVPITVAPAQGLSYLVGNKRATVAAAGMSDEPTTEDDATDDPAAEADLAQLLAEEVQTQAEEAETPTAEDAPTSEEAYGPHPLFLPLIRLSSADDGAADADTQLAGDEATEAYLSSESDAETAAIVIVSELTDAALIGEEASSTPPAEAAEEEAVETEALARRLFLPVVRR
jgi:hypothetical protein